MKEKLNVKNGYDEASATVIKNYNTAIKTCLFIGLQGAANTGLPKEKVGFFSGSLVVVS